MITGTGGSSHGCGVSPVGSNTGEGGACTARVPAGARPEAVLRVPPVRCASMADPLADRVAVLEITAGEYGESDV